MRRALTSCSCLLLMHMVAVQLQPAVGAPAAGSFVTRSGTQLLVDGKPFYHLGFNAYWMPPAITKFNDTETVDLIMDAGVRLGLNTIRTWAFAEGYPASPGVYNETQGRVLDYIIAAAGKRGLRLVFGLGNIWAAYLGPEVWLEWAEGTAANKTVQDFYLSANTAAMYTQHMLHVTNRVNTITGIRYSDDPTILGWDVLNEPRCPGCNSTAMAARDRFIANLTAEVAAAAPKQLTLSSTEGYFGANSSWAEYNPGAGAQCEGEDWPQEIRYFNIATTHMYYRQMEGLPPSWKKPSHRFYVQYLFRKLQLFAFLAGEADRPMIVEEFGLTRRWFNETEIRVVFAVVADALIASKRAGKPLMAAWFWNAAPTYQPDMGGYNVYITQPLTNKTVGLGNATAMAAFNAGLNLSSSVSLADLATASGNSAAAQYIRTAAAAQQQAANANAAVSSDGTDTAAATAGNSSGDNRAALMQPGGNTVSWQRVLNSTSAGLPVQSAGRHRRLLTYPASGLIDDGQEWQHQHGGWHHQQQRRLSQCVGNCSSNTGNTSSDNTTEREAPNGLPSIVVQKGEDVLDSFRNGAARAACAQASAQTWQVADIGLPLDYDHYWQMVANVSMVDILAEAARLLKQE